MPKTDVSRKKAPDTHFLTPACVDQFYNRVYNLMKTHYKVILVGDSCVGKTSLATSYSTGSMPEKNGATISAAYYGADVTVNGKTCTLDIWDTAGQEQYRALVPQYVRNAAAAIIVFDITNLSSFEHANDWYNFVLQNSENAYIVLFGNKNDLQDKRSAQIEDIAQWCGDHDLRFFEGSALNGNGTEELFADVAEGCMKTIKACKPPKEAVTLDGQTKTKGGCC